MPVNIYDKFRKAFGGTVGLVDAADVETTGNGNVQAELDAAIKAAVRSGNNIQFTRGDDTTFNVSVIDDAEPQFTAFIVGIQGENVTPPFTLTGSIPVSFNLINHENIDGTIDILQQTGVGFNTLLSGITPAASFSGNGTMNPAVTLNAGESQLFRVRGTSALGGGATIIRDYTVTALNPQDLLYISAEADNDPSDVNTAAATQIPFASGNQIVTIPTFADNAFLTILQRASDPDITGIIIGGIDQRPAFTKTDAAININAVSFDAYVSTNQLVGSVVSGTQMTLVRG